MQAIACWSGSEVIAVDLGFGQDCPVATAIDLTRSPNISEVNVDETDSVGNEGSVMVPGIRQLGSLVEETFL